MMVESQELEKEKESVIVDSEETTELAQAEALLEDEVASVPDDDSATASEEAEAGASDVAGADGEESIEEEEPGEEEEKEPFWEAWGLETHGFIEGRAGVDVMLFGAILIIVVLFIPDGLVGLGKRIWNQVRKPHDTIAQPQATD